MKLYAVGLCETDISLEFRGACTFLLHGWEMARLAEVTLAGISSLLLKGKEIWNVLRS